MNSANQPTVDSIATILEIDIDGDLERQTLQKIIDTDRESNEYAPFKLLLSEFTATAGNLENIAALADLRAKSNEITADIEGIFNNECAPQPVDADDWRRRLEQLQKNTQNIALDNALESFADRAEYLVKIVTYLLTMPRGREASLELLLDTNFVTTATRLWKKTQAFCVHVYRLLSSSVLVKSASAVVALLEQLEQQMVDVYDELTLCWQFATADRDQLLSDTSSVQRRSIRSTTKLCHYTESMKKRQHVQSKVKPSRSASPTRMPGAFVASDDDDDENSFALPDISMDEFERADMSSSCFDGSIFNIHFAVNCLMSVVSFLFTISKQSPHWYIDWQSQVNGVLGDLSQDFSSATALQRIGMAATSVAMIGVTARIKNWPRILAILATLGVGSLLLGTQTIVWLLFGAKDARGMAQPPLWFDAYTYTLNVLANNLHWVAYKALRDYDFLAWIGATSLSTISWLVDARTARAEQTLLLYTRKKITAGFAALAEYQQRHRQPLLLPSPTERRQPRLQIQAPSPDYANARLTTGYTRFDNDDKTLAMLREVQQKEEAARREQETLRRATLNNQATSPRLLRQARLKK